MQVKLSRVTYLISLQAQANLTQLQDSVSQAIQKHGEELYTYAVDELPSGQIHISFVSQRQLDSFMILALQRAVFQMAKDVYLVYDNSDLAPSYSYIVSLATDFVHPGRNRTFDQMRAIAYDTAIKYQVGFDGDYFGSGIITFMFTSFNDPISSEFRGELRKSLFAVAPYEVIFERPVFI